ncbi:MULTISPECIES: dATP/dGTP diphosphohydrolase domain-containing protein [unclassified Moraxella]|uniref:dATP/dGTP diphosphohydrolase domain-containing protein n=1 Tax=unclassified Moraxella TaxID=2685852 RepID=UPI002B415F8E|nr:MULTISPECIES: dATP/dGTP diphosphohydrolase domain-containing protein [unclassified Moraxella]
MNYKRITRLSELEQLVQQQKEKQRAEIGQKHDQAKPRFSLLPQAPLWQVVAVLEFGAGKYGVDNWRNVPNARERYFNACHRHLNAWWAGEMVDGESGLPHLAHAVCCLVFLMWFDGSEK